MQDVVEFTDFVGEQSRFVAGERVFHGAFDFDRETVDGEEFDGVFAAHLEALALEIHLGDVEEVGIEIISAGIERFAQHAFSAGGHDEGVTFGDIVGERVGADQ